MTKHSTNVSAWPRSAPGNPQLYRAAAAFVLALGLAPASLGRPSGLQVWLTCEQDIKVVCPGVAVFDAGAMRVCVRQNYRRLSDHCRSAVRDYQTDDPPQPAVLPSDRTEIG